MSERDERFHPKTYADLVKHGVTWNAPEIGDIPPAPDIVITTRPVFLSTTPYPQRGVELGFHARIAHRDIHPALPIASCPTCGKQRDDQAAAQAVFGPLREEIVRLGVPTRAPFEGREIDLYHEAIQISDDGRSWYFTAWVYMVDGKQADALRRYGLWEFEDGIVPRAYQVTNHPVWQRETPDARLWHDIRESLAQLGSGGGGGIVGKGQT